MKFLRTCRTLRIGLLGLLLACVLSVSHALELSGRIVGVIDGDTVDFITDGNELIRVRLAGIDAPERGQPFGSSAKKALSQLVFSKRVLLKGDKRDRYGRVIAKIIINGQDANLQLLRLGYAWHYKRYESEQTPNDRRLYASAQIEAINARNGLWKDSSPVAPWDYRASRRNASSSASGKKH